MLDLDFPQTVRRDLLLDRRATVIQELLEVLFGSFKIVPGQRVISQPDFFSHTYAFSLCGAPWNHIRKAASHGRCGRAML